MGYTTGCEKEKICLRPERERNCQKYLCPDRDMKLVEVDENGNMIKKDN
jgi:hypothetical protein